MQLKTGNYFIDIAMTKTANDGSLGNKSSCNSAKPKPPVAADPMVWEDDMLVMTYHDNSFTEERNDGKLSRSVWSSGGGDSSPTLIIRVKD